MSIVTLSNEVSVNPAFVTDVQVESGINRIRVYLEGGRFHSLPCKHGMSVWKTRDHYVAQINGEIVE